MLLEIFKFSSNHVLHLHHAYQHKKTTNLRFGRVLLLSLLELLESDDELLDRELELLPELLELLEPLDELLSDELQTKQNKTNTNSNLFLAQLTFGCCHCYWNPSRIFVCALGPVRVSCLSCPPRRNLNVVSPCAQGGRRKTKDGLCKTTPNITSKTTYMFTPH